MYQTKTRQRENQLCRRTWTKPNLGADQTKYMCVTLRNCFRTASSSMSRTSSRSISMSCPADSSWKSRVSIFKGIMHDKISLNWGWTKVLSVAPLFKYWTGRSDLRSTRCPHYVSNKKGFCRPHCNENFKICRNQTFNPKNRTQLS